MAMVTRRTIYRILLALLLTLVGHYAWELGQAQFFAEHAGAPLGSYALHCFIASLGDVVIASIAYAVAAVAFRRPAWPWAPHPLGPAALWLAVGLGITVVFELWATAVGRWTYAEEMPRLLGVGLLPLLQWLVVPTATLLLLRLMTRHPTPPARDRTAAGVPASKTESNP